MRGWPPGPLLCVVLLVVGGHAAAATDPPPSLLRRPLVPARAAAPRPRAPPQGAPPATGPPPAAFASTSSGPRPAVNPPAPPPSVPSTDPHPPATRPSRRSALRAALGASAASLLALGTTTAGPAAASQLPPRSVFLERLELISQGRPLARYEPGFVVYLTGFLLNYDEGFRQYWVVQRRTPRYQRTALEKAFYVKVFFRRLARQLETRIQQVKAKNLCALLWVMYSTTSIDTLHQLRVLFSLMPAETQPKEFIARGLQLELAYFNRTLADLTSKGEYLFSLHEEVAHPETTMVELLEDFRPPTLLPLALCPKFDESRKKWVIPDTGDRPTRRGAFSGSALGAQSLPTNHLGFNFNTFLLLSLAGGAASSVTHSLIQPIDVPRTKRAMAQFQGTGFYQAALQVHSQDGFVPIAQRNLAQFVGRLLYGATLYPSFELAKLFVATKVGVLCAVQYRFALVLSCSLFASLLGLIFLVPFESVRQRLIVDPTFARSIPAALDRIAREEGLLGLYGRYPYRVFRISAFNAAKFVVFDYFNDLVVLLFPTLLPGTEVTRATLALFKGCLAGLLGVLVSQPVEVVLQRAASSGQAPEDPKVGWPGALRRVVESDGPLGLFAGSEYRIIWAMTSISCSFFLYDGIKEFLIRYFF